jgi:hypothetical protein
VVQLVFTPHLQHEPITVRLPTAVLEDSCRIKFSKRRKLLTLKCDIDFSLHPHDTTIGSHGTELGLEAVQAHSTSQRREHGDMSPHIQALARMELYGIVDLPAIPRPLSLQPPDASKPSESRSCSDSISRGAGKRSVLVFQDHEVAEPTGSSKQALKEASISYMSESEEPVRVLPPSVRFETCLFQHQICASLS